MLIPFLLASALHASALHASVLHAPAADSSLTGTWRISGDVMGTPVNELCTLRQADSTVAGTCRNTDVAGAKTYDVTGTVKNGRVTFAHGGEYQGSALTLTYNGAIAAAPRGISGTIDVQPFGVNGTFSAAPATAAPATTAPGTTPPGTAGAAAPAKP